MTAIPIKKFQEGVEIAIKRYKLHEEKISNERVKDISNIKKIICSNSIDYYGTKNNLFKYLEKMKTGWTGNSNLKKFIKEEVKNLKKSCPEKLITPMGQIPLETETNKIYSKGWSLFTLFSLEKNTSIQEKQEKQEKRQIQDREIKNKMQSQPTLKKIESILSPIESFIFTFMK